MELYNTYTKTKEITEVIVTKPTKQAIRAAKSQLGKSEEATTKPSREAGQPDPKWPDRLVSGRYMGKKEKERAFCKAAELTICYMTSKSLLKP